jgi:hypothetical protein
MAIDACEPQVIRALEKDGWQILAKPYVFRLVGRNLFADMSLQRVKEGQIERAIILEVKCFTNPQADLSELYTAVGQYEAYRSALILEKDTTPIYLSIPLNAYERLIQEPIVPAIFQVAGIKLVVVDIETEEVVQWLN